MYQGTQESVASISSTDYLRMLQHLFPELALRDIVLGVAQSIATKHANLWYVIPAWQEMFADDEPLASRLAELSALADSRKRALDGNEAREKAALRLIQEQRYAEAIPIFETVLAARAGQRFRPSHARLGLVAYRRQQKGMASLRKGRSVQSR